ncbi:hypothetical protein TKK_0002641 [Trichogramma kaykai]
MYINKLNKRGPEVDCISCNIEGIDFDQAVDIIKKPSAKYQASFILMFRKVGEFPKINYEEYLQMVKGKCMTEHLVKVSDEGIYKNVTKKLDAGRLETVPETFLIDENVQSSLDPSIDQWKYCCEHIDDLFKNSNRESLYIRDITDPPKGSSNVL